MQILPKEMPDRILRELWYETCAEARRRGWMQPGNIVPPESPAPAVGGEAQGSPMRPMHTFPSGAKRSELKPRYDLIPASPLRRLAARYAMGAERYGEYNWQKGLPISDTLNHVIDHLLRYKEQLNSPNVPFDPDDDLAAAAWGVFALMYYEERSPRAHKTPNRNEELLGAAGAVYEQPERPQQRVRQEQPDRGSDQRDVRSYGNASGADLTGGLR